MVSTIFRNSFLNSFNRLILSKKSVDTGIRTLYSSNALGVDNYVKTREKVAVQFREISDKFKSKMNEYSDLESSNMIFTEDLKHIVHLVEPNDCDLNLVEQMMIKFSKQNKELRFGSFIFGPVVMRMYYYLNKPNEALKIFKNPDMAGFFDQLISFQILMDLLYNNEMYTEMLEIFDIISDKQLQGSKYPKNSVVLVLAACYKLNNENSFNYAKKLWSNLNEIGHFPMRRAGTFAAALALLHNSPDIALEILTSMKQQNYVTIRNLKVAALSDLGRPDDAFPILRSVLEVDTSNREIKHTFSEEIFEKVRSAVEKSNNTDLKNELQRIEKQLHSLGFITSDPIDALLCKEITLPPNTSREQNNLNRKFVNSRNKSYQRPSLRNMI